MNFSIVQLNMNYPIVDVCSKKISKSKRVLEKGYSEWKEFFDSGLAEEARKVPMNSLVGTVINMLYNGRGGY